jgi:Domain of Unknown Function with PDB structure (DUF3857)/Transglutaminase-like superfamily
MKALLTFLTVLSFQVADAQWDAAKIPADLKEKAHAVMRMKETIFTVKNMGEATQTVHYVVTILDEQGQDYATAPVFYDKFDKINDIEGALYDAKGEKVKRLKKDDIKDYSAISGFSLFEDHRYKLCEFKYANYPFTVEFKYEITTKNMMMYPSWFPHSDVEDLAIEQDFFKVTMPAGLDMRYKEMNGIGKPNITDINGGKSYLWMVQNVKVGEKEPYSPKWTKRGPGVLTAPTWFEVQGYRGDMRTWKDLGDFDNILGENRDVLPENVKQEVIELTKNISDPTLKIKKVYEYLQSKTRYISVQLGIGGWQPFEAKYVAEKGYGDCKALSNYGKALLKAIGIESHYTSVRAGDDAPEILADFPAMNQFNHAILCVPMKADTIWLECTSQNNPFGYMGDFTGNRQALLATPQGGKLVNTPRYMSVDNWQTKRVDVTLAEDGNATAEAKETYSGILQDDYANAMEVGAEDQKKFLYKHINIPSFELNQHSITQEKLKIPKSKVKLSLTVRKCAAKSGTRMFLSPNLMSAVSYIPPISEKTREAEVELINAFTEIDTIVYTLPKNLSIEAQPSPMKIETKFGTYQSESIMKDGKLIYVRKLVRNKGKFPATVYPELVDFYKKISKFDKSQVVLKIGV